MAELVVNIENGNEAETVAKMASDFKGIENVLLMAMSTLPYASVWELGEEAKDNPIRRSTHKYDKNILENSDVEMKESENSDDKPSVTGYGQMEPVPRLLIENGKTPLLILVMASADAQKKKCFYIKTPDEKLELIENKSAVDFFEDQISEYANQMGTRVQFKVLKTGDSDIVAIREAVRDATGIIRIIKDDNKNREKEMKLYLDIHGGKRQDQTIVEAIVNMLRIEDIKLEAAFSISGGPAPIERVDSSLEIFDFVSGMNEFINYGYGQSLENYVESYRKPKDNNSDTWCGNLAKNISEVTDALSLCQVSAFEEALDHLKETIGNNSHEYPLFDIFINNIKRDYGNLLSDERTLYDEVAWALRKGFYQQCLAIIEANTPKYVFEHFFENNLIDAVLCDNPSESVRGDFLRLERNGGDGPASGEDYENYYMRTMFFLRNGDIQDLSTDTEHPIPIVTFKYRGKKTHREVLVKYKKRFDFDVETFVRFGRIWWEIKEDFRNKVFHVDNDHPVGVDEVKGEIKDYLKRLVELMSSMIVPLDQIYDAKVICLKRNNRGKTSLWVKLDGKCPLPFENFVYDEDNKKGEWQQDSDGRITNYRGEKKAGDKIKVKFVRVDDHKAIFEEYTE